MSIAQDTVSSYVYLVLGILLMVLGTVGNVTSLFILNRNALRRLKIRPYLIALAIFDLLILYLTLLPSLIFLNQKSNAKPRSATQCKIMIYSGFFAIDSSSWITVAITIERLLYIIRPHMVRPQRGTTIALSLVIGLVAVINIPIAMGWTSVGGKCQVAKFYYLIHFAMFSYIPATIMVLSNSVIIFTLCRRPDLGSSSSGNQRKNSIRMAIAINLVFLSTVFPVSVVWAIVNKLYLPLYVMLYANYAINFVFYIIAGQLFREELYKCCYRKQNSYCPTTSNNAIGSAAPPATATASTTDTSV